LRHARFLTPACTNKYVYNTPFGSEAEIEMTDSGSKALRVLLALLNLLCIAVIGAIILNIDPDKLSSNNDFVPRTMSTCVMDQDGYLHGELYGSLETTLDWQGATMLCDGMARPEGRGIRLVFAEQVDPEIPGLIIVIGLADAVLGEPKSELTANVTLLDQRARRIYSTQEEARCWVQLINQLQLHGTTTETWRLDGELYCASALAALTGTGSVTLDDFVFSGIMKPAPAQ
jgi:hypothetical protein